IVPPPCGPGKERMVAQGEGPRFGRQRSGSFVPALRTRRPGRPDIPTWWQNGETVCRRSEVLLAQPLRRRTMSPRWRIPLLNSPPADLGRPFPPEPVGDRGELAPGALVERDALGLAAGPFAALGVARELDGDVRVDGRTAAHVLRQGGNLGEE